MNLKNIILAVLIFTLTNCSIDGENNPKIVRVEWHLKNVSGGVNGVNNDFDFNVIIWNFNQTLNSLEVDNNNTDDSKEDGLDSGTYTYSLVEQNNKTYLVISENELGSITFSNNQMTINQNEKSSGNGADGFIYTFLKVLITE